MNIVKLICFFCCLPVTLAAGDGYRFRYIDLPEILRDASINNPVADRAGMLWFCTSSGLHRYDGNQLLTFNQVSHPAIAGNFINALYADKNDQLWIGTQNGLTRFDLRNWTTHTIAQLSENEGLHVNQICEGSDGLIYIGTNDGKFFHIKENRLHLLADLGKAYPANPTRTSISFLQEGAPGQFWVLSNHRLFSISREGEVYNPGIEGTITTPIYFYGGHHVIFNIADEGFHEYDLQSKETHRLGHPFNDAVNEGKRIFLFPLANEEVGILINKRGFFSYNPFTGKAAESMKGTDVNFLNLRATNVQSVGDRAYISFNKSVAELQQVHTPFTNLLVNPSFETSSNSVRSILKHPNGLLYAGTYSDGFISLDERTGEKKNLGIQFVYASMLWDEQHLLLATEGDGLLWYNVPQNRFEEIRGDTLHTQPEDQVRDRFFTSLTRESDSLVWVGGYNGVFLLNPYTGVSSYVRQGNEWQVLRQAKVYQVLKVGPCRYFATTDGLFAYYPEKASLQRVLKDVLYTVEQFGDELWVGTNGKGILILDEKGRVKRELNTQNGLAGNAVYFMLQQENEIVVGTDQGLSIIQLSTRQIRNYTRMQNLPSNEFNHSAAYADGNQVYLGTINGLTIFNTAELAQYGQQQHNIPLYFTSITTGNKNGTQHTYTLPYQQEKRLEIGSDVQYFSLRFGGVDAAVNQVYYYRASQDAPWLEIGRQREMSFAGIAPGTYMVQLAAKLNGSTAFTTLLTMPVIVKPAWYETIWFRVLWVLCILMGIWLLFRYRMQQVLREQRLRTKIAGDLHDEVGSSLTRIYFQADHLSMQHGDKVALQKIADSSKHALSTMSDMVWSIDARFDTAEDLVARIRDYISNLQNDLDIICTFELQGDYTGKPLSQVVRQNFFLIFKEAMNNAARYCSEPCLQVSLSFHKNIRLSVCNPYTGENGKMKQYQGGRGIQHMKERAARMKGRLTAEKEEGAFVVQLHIPF